MATAEEIRERVARVFRRHPEVCFVAVSRHPEVCFVAVSPRNSMGEYYVWASVNFSTAAPHLNELRRLLRPLREALAPFGVVSSEVYRDGMSIERHDAILYLRA